MSKTKPQSPFLESISKMPCVICERPCHEPYQITATPPGFPPYPGNFAPLCKIHLLDARTMSTGELIKRYRVFYLWLVQNRRQDVLKTYQHAVIDAGWNKKAE